MNVSKYIMTHINSFGDVIVDLNDVEAVIEDFQERQLRHGDNLALDMKSFDELFCVICGDTEAHFQASL